MCVRLCCRRRADRQDAESAAVRERVLVDSAELQAAEVLPARLLQLVLRRDGAVRAARVQAVPVRVAERQPLLQLRDASGRRRVHLYGDVAGQQRRPEGLAAVARREQRECARYSVMFSIRYTVLHSYCILFLSQCTATITE